MKNNRYQKLIGRINWYPPYLGAGIRVKSYNDDMTRFEVVLKPRWYTRNLFGTHFGGALYSMADPFFVFIVLMNLGKEFIVWDKSAGIEFLKPARGVITGVFEISRERLAEIGEEVRRIRRNTYRFEASLTDEGGQVVARVSKEVYVRLKSAGKGSRGA